MERIEHAIDINAPLKATYAQGTRFSDYPRFMEGVDAVRMADERHLHWHAIRNGEVVEWSSVITERDPERFIAWHDMDGPHRAFTLSFSELDKNKTRLVVAVSLPADAGNAESRTLQKESLSQRLLGDLERFKKLMENEGHDWNEWPSTHDKNAVSGQTVPVFDKAEETSLHEAEHRTQQDFSHPGTSSRHEGEHHEPGVSHAGLGETGKKLVQGLLQGWDQPLSIARKMSSEMDQLFERLTGRSISGMSGKWGASLSGRWMPAVDVMKSGDELIISADLPGVAKQDVHIEIHDDKLTIEGERREPAEKKILPGYRRPERQYGCFYRQLPLPAGVPPEQIHAKLLNGVLEIRMPLTAGMGTQGRRVNIEDFS